MGVVVLAVSPGQRWRHACPHCGTTLGPRGNLGTLSPRGRCGACGQHLGPPAWTVELATVISAVVLWQCGLTGWALVGYSWWAALGIILSFVDISVQRLPARLSYAAAGGLVAVLLVEARRTHGWQPWIRSVLGALAMPALVHWGDLFGIGVVA
jgi:leader peptidase (prepilin peptidase) / N-methyltransferase